MRGRLFREFTSRYEYFQHASKQILISVTKTAWISSRHTDLESKLLEQEFDMGSFIVWSFNFRKCNIFVLKVEFQFLLGLLLLVSGFKGLISDDGLQIEFTADLISNVAIKHL